MKKKWLIEELYSSEDCRHYVLGGPCVGDCDKTGDVCKKETCPLKVGK